MTGEVDTALLRRDADFVRSTVDWTWETDSDLRIIALSSRVTAIMGKAAVGWLGRPLGELGHLGDGPLTRRPLPNGSFGDQYLTIGDGSDARHYRLSGVRLFDSDGSPAGFAGSARAVADLPRPRSGFLAEVGREFREPLQAIVGLAEAMSRVVDGPLATRYADYARDIVQSSRHLLSFVEGMLRPKDEPALECRQVSASAVVAQAVAMVALSAEAKRIAIYLPPAAETMLAGDERSVCQILVNLLGNAVKFTPEGGRIVVDIAAPGTGEVELSVQDTGPGIAPGDQQRIFGRFERAGTGSADAPGSVGLGLHISRELAERMGGTLAVESRPGHGARFALRLPAA